MSITRVRFVHESAQSPRCESMTGRSLTLKAMWLSSLLAVWLHTSGLDSIHILNLT
jgi:hypothetical protein